MKKSVLTSLIAASALFAGVAFAGGYTADAGYTAADTSASAGNANSLLDGLYVGVGVNHSAENESKKTFNDVTTSELDTSNYGWSALVGKNLNDIFAVELSYNSFGKNTFTNTLGEVSADYYQLWDTSVVGVINSPSFSGFSAHAKAGAAYLSEKGKTGIEGVTLETSSATTLVYGLGLQYNFDRFGLSFDWTRFQNNSNQNTTSGDLYVPDQFGLNFIYTIA
jgi:hypothetical protein